MDKYLDSTLTPEERAEDLLEKLSPEEKVAQISCLFAGHDRIEEAAKYGIGQVSLLEMRRTESLAEAAAWQREMQKQIMEQSPHHIPAVFHMEGLCGAFIQDAASFPAGINRGASFDPELEKTIGEIVSRQERAVGISQVLAPVLDISRDSRLGRQGETYGEDPTLASAMGAAFVKGIQEGDTDGRKAESVAKHFLAFHNSEGGIHGAVSDTPRRMLEEIYGKPFQAAITESEIKGIMPCYGAINGRPASASHTLLTKILREEMGFQGVTLADYSAITNVHTAQNMFESLAEAGLECLKAGMDVELPRQEAYNLNLLEYFRDGSEDMEILNQAVRRELTAKFRMGLFENPYALQGDDLTKAFYDEKDQQVSLRSARESLVLLKNDGTLPIQKNIRKIAVVGCHAANARIFFGGYTHLSMVEAIHAVENSIAGISAAGEKEKRIVPLIPGTQIQSDETEEFDRILKKQKPNCRNLLDWIKLVLPDTQIEYAYGYPIAGNDTSHFQDALQAVKDSDLVILTLGGKHGSCSVASMGEGVDSTDINLPYCQDEFIRQAAKLKKPMVGVHFNGRPISSDAADQYLNAIIEAFSPSEMGGQAIAEVLAGDVNPSGKMPVSTARNAGQIPIYYNHVNGSSYHQSGSIGFQDYVDQPHTPRYFFGHGLSYTTFCYDNLQIDKKEVQSNESLTISLDITNSGVCDGTEVVQLYLTDQYASMIRPVMELAGFARVPLKKGETKRISFRVDPSQTAFLDEEYHWKIEAGVIKIAVGSSSEDIRLRDEFRIRNDAVIDGKTRGFYSIGEVR